MKLKNIIKIGSFVVAGALPTASKAQVYMCQACPAGTYSDGTKTQCTPCPAGTYSNGGASECKACPAGKYSPAGSSECKDCTAGTYSTGGAGSCSGCSQPTYSNWSRTCGNASRTKTTYCTTARSTSATANASTSTETKNLGNCPDCKVYKNYCVKRYSSGACQSCSSSSSGECSETKEYVKYGTRLTSYKDKGFDYSTGDGTRTYTYYHMRYSNGVWCYTNQSGSCTCQ